ncbi:MAG TPA: S41 family peptidase, partial [Kofleriaceae bacterium]
ADASLLNWIDTWGPVPPCHPCATLDEHDLAIRPDLAWIDALEPKLAARLHAIDAARVPGQQYYVALAEGTSNPVFVHQASYSKLTFPDAGFQYLALVRLWNIVEYWAPNRELADHWGDQLAKLLPSVMLATTDQAYKQAMMAAIAKVHDTHANLWSSLDVRPPLGACDLAAKIRFVEKQAVVTEPTGGLQRGDVITTIDGATIESLVTQWSPLYADSNEAAQLRDIAEAMTRGPCGDVALGVKRGTAKVTVKATRGPRTQPGSRTHDLPGPTFRMLSPDLAYLKLSTVHAADLAHYVEQAAGTKGWIIDIRNYPSEFMVFDFGGMLVDKKTPFARFTSGDLSNPGAFHWSENVEIEPTSPHYGKKVVVLVDEVSQSQAEYTSMAFRAAPQTVIVGSTTAGADGDISKFSLPGGLFSMVSGLGVFYPDKKPTQRIGIIPDVVVTPTIAGIRAGRDEVLEAGIREILGRSTSATQIQQIVRSQKPDATAR